MVQHNIFSAAIQKVSKSKFPGWGANMESTIIVRLSTAVREAIYFLVVTAEKTIQTRTGRGEGWQARRLHPGCLYQDDEPGFSVLRLDPGDEFDAAVLRETLILAYRRVKPAFPGPDIGVTAEVRALVAQLDEWLKTPIVDRLSALGVLPDEPTT